MPAITTLYTLPRVRQAEWIDATGTYNVTADVVRVVSDWADCPRSSVDFDEHDMITVDGEPVAWIERKHVKTPVVDLRPAGPVDLAPYAPYLQAAE